MTLWSGGGWQAGDGPGTSQLSRAWAQLHATSTSLDRFVKTQTLALTPALLNQISGEGLNVPRFKQVA